MLGSSDEYEGDDVARTLKNDDDGVKHGRELSAFARAVLGGDPDELHRARGEIRSLVGEAALVDAAAVIANFSMVDRVADAIGIPLDFEVDIATAKLRSELGIDALSTARNTPDSLMRRTFRALLRPFGRPLGFIFRSAGGIMTSIQSSAERDVQFTAPTPLEVSRA